MTRMFIALVTASLVGNVPANDKETPPDSWRMAFRDEKQEVWDRLRRNDGTVTAEEVIEETLKRGSQHDGDCQVWTAFALMEINDDPIPALRKMMTEEVPERRAFGAMVAGILGDIRLRPDIEKLLKDRTKLGAFPGDWFWETVGDSARFSISELERGGAAGDWIANGGSIAKWLKHHPSKPVEHDGRLNGLQP